MNRSELPLCTVSGNSIILSLHIQPRASRNEVCGIQDQALKLRLTSPPVDGAANRLCREFLADILGVPKSAISIVAGETSRHKRIRIDSNDAGRIADLVRKLASSDN